MKSAVVRADEPIGGGYVVRRRSSGTRSSILMLLALGITGWYFLGRDSVRTTTDMAMESYRANQPVATVTAPEIMAFYQRNEVAADSMYREKIVDISGYVTAIKKDMSDDLYVTLDGGGAPRYRSVQAYFSKSMTSQLAGLQKGQKVLVRCRIEGLFINVRGTDCKIL